MLAIAVCACLTKTKMMLQSLPADSDPQILSCMTNFFGQCGRASNLLPVIGGVHLNLYLNVNASASIRKIVHLCLGRSRISRAFQLAYFESFFGAGHITGTQGSEHLDVKSCTSRLSMSYPSQGLKNTSFTTRKRGFPNFDTVNPVDFYFYFVR